MSSLSGKPADKASASSESAWRDANNGYAHVEEKIALDANEKSTGIVATRPNFDHVDEKKVLRKVSQVFANHTTSKVNKITDTRIDGHPPDSRPRTPLPPLIPRP